MPMAENKCESCGADAPPRGRMVCTYCFPEPAGAKGTPVLDSILRGETKVPMLCVKCMEQHEREHGGIENIPNPKRQS
jgi:hypothetical protein